MQKTKFVLQELVALRQHFHKHAEPSFKEFETSKTLRSFLHSKGVTDAQITDCAVPGFYVDIKGQGPALGPQGSPVKMIAFRADMDGLVMKETNPGIEYISITEAAHMCGHDGHMACLLGGLTKLLDNIDKLPSDRVARFLFQPAEESIGGAKVMVAQGCLDGVHEVWGLHNIPWDPIGQVYVKGGPFFACVSVYQVTIEGKGGHSSLKGQLNNPVPVLCEMNLMVENMLKTDFPEANDKGFTFCMPNMKTSDSDNVIPTTVSMRGVMRTLDDKYEPQIVTRMNEIARELEAKHNVKIEVTQISNYPLINNNYELAEELKRIHPGCSEDKVPLLAGEDFSEFSNKVPGCFFLYSVGSNAGTSLHIHNYNFNDECIEDVSNLWYKIIADRLDINQ